MGKRILDSDVRDALEVLEAEFHSMEDLNKDLNAQLRNLDEENTLLTIENAKLKKQVKDLEEALAEAHLTGDDSGKKS